MYFPPAGFALALLKLCACLADILLLAPALLPLTTLRLCVCSRITKTFYSPNNYSLSSIEIHNFYQIVSDLTQNHFFTLDKNKKNL